MGNWWPIRWMAPWFIWKKKNNNSLLQLCPSWYLWKNTQNIFLHLYWFALLLFQVTLEWSFLYVIALCTGIFKKKISLCIVNFWLFKIFCWRMDLLWIHWEMDSEKLNMLTAGILHVCPDSKGHFCHTSGLEVSGQMQTESKCIFSP